MLQQVPKKNPIPTFNAPDKTFLNSKGYISFIRIEKSPFSQ
jgi:hypothetical protein